MLRTIRTLVIVLLIAGSASSLFAAPAETPRQAWPGYAFSILLGFGTGQYYLGANGTPFLIGDAGGLLCIAGGSIYMLSALATVPLNPTTSLDTVVVGYGIIGVGALVWVISRVWEIVDVFGTAERLRQEGKVASLQPVIDVRPDAVALEVSYSY